MERRVLLAISLSFLVLFLYQALIIGPAPDVPPSAPPGSGVATGPTVPPQGSSAPPATPLLPPVPPPTAEEIVVGDPAERTIVLENELVRATFTNRGGRLAGWELKQYQTSTGAPVDLIPDAVPASPVLPFSLRVDDATLSGQLNSAIYRTGGLEGGTPHTAGGAASVEYALELATGVKATKRFTLEPASYVLSVQVAVEQHNEALTPTIVWGPGLGDEIAQSPPGSFLTPNYRYPAQAIFLRGGSVERSAPESLPAAAVHEGQFGYAGIDDQYFVAATVTPGTMRLEYTPLTLPAAPPAGMGRYVDWSVQFRPMPESIKFFVGPKQFDVLRAVDPEFTKVIYFGMFAWLAAPLLGALRWVNGFVGNYGWSIVILTILINFAMWPLRHKSVVSMRRMQELQPQLKAIQDRYAKYKITDPERQKMNSEVMDLYRSKGANPASGCVPMLLTLPFLFAFYAMLSQAIEIRGADFLGWIDDLSSHDPLYVTPLLMGATMFWQQRLTPSTADPMQQRIMMAMPLMFMFMFLWAPSGLVIYWLVSNLWAIGQQYFTNYLIGPPKVHNVRPPAERGDRTSERGPRAGKPSAGAKA